ncbi:hypothetical protein [Alkalicoccus luteus]|uniref:hypothetical protein n=1 Tax=Alkalicoccus luteus TaxID=1237094 RepID=UPI004033FA81
MSAHPDSLSKYELYRLRRLEKLAYAGMIVAYSAGSALLAYVIPLQLLLFASAAALTSYTIYRIQRGPREPWLAASRRLEAYEKQKLGPDWPKAVKQHNPRQKRYAWLSAFGVVLLLTVGWLTEPGTYYTVTMAEFTGFTLLVLLTFVVYYHFEKKPIDLATAGWEYQMLKPKFTKWKVISLFAIHYFFINTGVPGL